MTQRDLYYNPNPVARLVGPKNETQVIFEGYELTALIDTGAQISAISESLACQAKLEIRDLGGLLTLEQFSGAEAP